jgi:prepilin-type N-terminal cleavage/methylation domain-containing protein
LFDWWWLSDGKEVTGMKTTKRGGFTLIELAIVICVIAIIAVIAIPNLVRSRQEAKEAGLAGELAVLRNAIDLYYEQHGVYPGAVKTDGSGEPTDEDDNPNAFVDQLTLWTDESGKTSKTSNPDFPFDPYLETGIPPNPVALLGEIADKVEVTGDTGPLLADNEPVGWKYSKETGQFIANLAAYAKW